MQFFACIFLNVVFLNVASKNGLRNLDVSSQIVWLRCYI